LQELLEFNYDATFEDRRVTIDHNHGCTCEPGMGKIISYRAFLGDWFQNDLMKVQVAAAERIVFWFYI
jgi:uncharacterized membrane protein (GlpM family)